MINNNQELNLNQEEENGESINITDKSAFSITSEQVEKKKSLRIENQTFYFSSNLANAFFDNYNIEQIFFIIILLKKSWY